MKATGAICGLFLSLPAAAGALTLDFPGFATPIADFSVVKDSHFLPTDPFFEGPIEGLNAEGAIRKQSWRVTGGGLTTLQLLAPLREQLQAAGYETLFECEADACGGFDFRYQIDVLPEPEMHVNLGDYRYFSGKRVTEDGPEYVSLIVSRSANAGFVQLTRVGAPEASVAITAATKAPTPTLPLADSGPVGEQLEAKGHATLDDLYFKTGSSELGDEGFASLTGLADYLKAHPDRRVTLVGHTDAEGALDANIALSKRRAAAVASRLVERHGIDPAQISADGVGYLAPRASNLTPEGRTQNRRVEAILTSTQ